MRTFNAQSIRVSLGALATLPFAVLLASGCGSTAANTVTAPQGNAAAFIVGTDAPLPSVTAFDVQLQSITATNAAGTSVSLLSGSPTVDFARFNGLQTLIDMNDVPADTYTSVTVTLGTASIGYLNVTPGAAPTIQTEAATLTTNTITKTLAVPLVLSETAPVGLHMDFDLRKSIQVDSTGNITGAVTPTFNLSVVGRSDSGAYIDEFDAAVVSVNQNAQTFTIEGPHGRQFTVDVNGQTEWDNGEGLGDLTTSSIVQISGTLDRADSTFDADDVSIVSQNGFFAAGLLTYVAPSTGPATSFDLYVHGLLPTTTGLTLGQIGQVDLTGGEKYFIRRMHDPLTRYLFNASTLLPGQHVNIGGPASGGTDHRRLAVGAELPGDNDVDGQDHLAGGEERSAASIWSASSSELPTPRPCAARNVKHMPPPTSRRSTVGSRLSITASLSDTFDPPSTTTYGRSGDSVRRCRTSISRSTRSPAACGSWWDSSWTLACARCTAPNASLT